MAEPSGFTVNDPPPESDAEAFARLAKLPALEYDRVREAEAKTLKCRVATLDAMVQSVRSAPNDNTPATGADGNDPRPPEFSDEALALRFSEKHHAQLRYVSEWGKWFIYDGKIWVADNSLRAFDWVRSVCRTASAECREPKMANDIAAGSTISAVERLARADRRHAAVAEQFDVDSWALNTPSGVINLRTLELRPHQPSDHLTKITAVAAAGDCPRWRDFLSVVTGGDKDLQLYLQRMAGYALTGSTREHALFFAYGLGGNGKGTFLNTLTGILNTYATVASMETFTASPGERHPTDLAMLRSARLVTAQETEEGRRWAEARIKALTGGDPITARFMRQDFFTFIPQFKLIVSGNHKPGLRSVDDAIRRRFNLIPFSVRITEDKKDPELAEKLHAEWPGILQWAVDGCMLWQERGLAPPASVLDATAGYLEAEDAMATWMSEACLIDKTLYTTSSDLFASWKFWAERAGEFPGSQKRFSQAIEARGFTSKRNGIGRAGFIGIGLKPSDGHWSDGR